MTNPHITLTSRQDVDDLLGVLGDELERQGARYELLIAGGASLIARGRARRSTRAIDIVGLVEDGRPVWAVPLPGLLSKARCQIARDLRIRRAWLTNDHAGIFAPGRDCDGFVARAETRCYGPALTVHFASRTDELELKFAACVGLSPSEHDDDLRALEPTEAELFAAARRALGADWDPGSRLAVIETLDWFGADPEPADLETPDAIPAW
jgi:hypothetical protein